MCRLRKGSKGELSVGKDVQALEVPFLSASSEGCSGPTVPLGVRHFVCSSNMSWAAQPTGLVMLAAASP